MLAHWTQVSDRCPLGYLFCIHYSCPFPFLLVPRAFVCLFCIKVIPVFFPSSWCLVHLFVYFVYVIPVFFPSSWCLVHVFILYTLFLSFSVPLGASCMCLFCIRYSCLFPFLLVSRACVYFVYVIPVFSPSS